MTPLTPAFLIAAASSFVGLREEGGDNRGLMVELFLREVSQPAGQPWCAAFVYHVGFWSHFDYKGRKSTWPLPATASCYMLGAFARHQGVLRTEPSPGDVFLLWNAAKVRFVHTGIVAFVHDRGASPDAHPWFDCETVEGNTNDDGSSNGWGVLRRVRRFYPDIGDRFIHWADLDRRPFAGSAMAQATRAA